MNEQAWTVDAEARSSGIMVRIAHADWPAPAEYVEQNHWHVLNMSMTSIPEKIEGCLAGGSASGERVGVGALVFGPANSRMDCRGSGGVHQRVVRAFLDPALMPARLPAASDFTPEQFRRCLDIHSPEIAGIMSRLCHETLQPTFGSRILLESLGAVISVELQRIFAPDLAQPPEAPTGKSVLTKKELSRVIDYVDSRVSVNITITEVATACNMSCRTLTRKFKNTTGETLHQYAHRRATRRARALLSDRSRSVKEISYELGFVNPSAFSIAFRRATGLSPSEYRHAAS